MPYAVGVIVVHERSIEDSLSKVGCHSERLAGYYTILILRVDCQDSEVF